MSTLKAGMRAILEQKPELSRNDLKLEAAIWADELKAYPNIVTASDFLTAYAEGKFTNPQTIRRTRQKLATKAVPA